MTKQKNRKANIPSYFSHLTPRRKIKDRRDSGGGAGFLDPPTMSEWVLVRTVIVFSNSFVDTKEIFF